MPPHSESLIVRVIAVHKHYRLDSVEVKALSNIHLEIARGEFMALAGTSGSGKTTLLNLIGCIDAPTTGELWITRHKVNNLKPAELAHLRANKIGYVFQTFNLIPTLTALENVEYPLLLLGTGKKERRQRAAETLERVGLKDLLHRRPSALSGGQRQRIAIARAIVKRPTLVLADEPTANLGRRTAEEVLNLMQRLNESDGLTFIFSSHDPAVLQRAKRVVPLADGRQVSPLSVDSGATDASLRREIYAA